MRTSSRSRLQRGQLHEQCFASLICLAKLLFLNFDQRLRYAHHFARDVAAHAEQMRLQRAALCQRGVKFALQPAKLSLEECDACVAFLDRLK